MGKERRTKADISPYISIPFDPY